MDRETSRGLSGQAPKTAMDGLGGVDADEALPEGGADAVC